MGLNFILGDIMEVYEHILDGNEPYEDWVALIFSMEPVTVSDFKKVINDAQEALVEERGYKGDWNDVALKITEIDDRFFFPQKGRIAIVNREESKVIG